MFTLGRRETARWAVPHWLIEERELAQVNEYIRKCTAFVGYPTDHNGFCAVGTGFFVNITDEEFDFGYFVTAAHLVWPQRWKSNADAFEGQPVSLRVDRKTDEPDVQTVANTDWVFHPDKRVDLCALPSGINTGTTDGVHDVLFSNIQNTALVGDYLERSGLTYGDEVFIAGAFVGRIGEKRNIPIIRIGNIAAMPEEPISYGSPRKPAYLIETRSLGGTSGSPVFFSGTTHRTQGPRLAPPVVGVTNTQTGKTQITMIMPYALVGMVLRSISGNYAEEFPDEDGSIVPSKDADFNSGISIVMTAADILDFLKNDKILKNMRSECLAESRARSGVRET